MFESGIQVPAGTVRPAESPEDAVLREAREETGLDGLEVVSYLGSSEYEAHTRHFFQLRVSARPPREWTWHELHDGLEPPTPFRFCWIPLAHGGVVSGCQGYMLSRVSTAT